MILLNRRFKDNEQKMGDTAGASLTPTQYVHKKYLEERINMVLTNSTAEININLVSKCLSCGCPRLIKKKKRPQQFSKTSYIPSTLKI